MGPCAHPLLLWRAQNRKPYTKLKELYLPSSFMQSLQQQGLLEVSYRCGSFIRKGVSCSGCAGNAYSKQQPWMDLSGRAAQKEGQRTVICLGAAAGWLAGAWWLQWAPPPTSRLLGPPQPLHSKSPAADWVI